ncbi:hypothetical protein PsorP6_012022 [Peronosclerospora sorghi]|uniref:Uncharacterized protein n=1 Tax=Peronosclerospora sorghi TaxID=230839 RepID=A0ACC0WL40_9STRA|nr:hypothetical protein PsorP6_012022 [Peronosclerospora sorghi]
MFSILGELLSPAERLAFPDVKYHLLPASEYEANTKDVFEHPDIQRWIQSPSDYNGEQAVRVIATLTDKIGGDSTLYSILNEASNERPGIFWGESSKSNIATQLIHAQLWYWISVNRDPETVFIVYGLAEKGRNILEGPEFLDWVTYDRKFNARQGNPELSATKILLKYFSRDELYQYIEDARLSYDSDMNKNADVLVGMLQRHKEVTTG